MDTKPQSHLVEVQNLSVTFKLDESEVAAVQNVSFHIDRGETLALVGESGSGKSVTARAIMKLLPRTADVSGESRVLLAGTRIDQFSERQMLNVRGDRISMIFQEPMSSLNPIYRVGSQIAEAVVLHQRLTKRQALARALDLLKEVRIPEPEARLEQYPHQLSGGQRQRVMIAMAIATDPDVLIADEPTTTLDVTTQARIMELLDRIVEERGMGVILITHDLGLASSFCEDMHVMYGGRIVESGPAPAVLRTLVHPYSEALLESICTIDRDVHRPIAAISGQPPLPDQLPSGCPFHPHCAYAQEVCVDVAPPPIPVDGRVTECHFPLVGDRP